MAMVAQRQPEAQPGGCCGGKAAPVQPEEPKTPLQLELLRAQALAERGNHEEAARARERAADIALRVADDEGGEGEDPEPAATALLMHAHVLLEEGEWPSAGLGLQDRLQQALKLTRRAKRRNRGLEGQLIYTWSRAVFANPGGVRSGEEMDQAIQSRLEAVQLLVDAEVEQLPWKPERLRGAAEAVEDDESSHEPLLQDQLMLEVIEILGDAKGKRTSAKITASALASLFDAWSEPGGVPLPDGSVGCRISVAAFLKKAADAAERLCSEDDGAAAAEAACAAPCDGGVPGLSKPEQALLALVARDGSGQWENKLREMQNAGTAEAGSTAESLRADWLRMAPGIKRVTDKDQQMSCGHSCSTCPTRESCQVHTALRDIEDM